LRFGGAKNVSYTAALYRTVRSKVGTDAMRKLFGVSKELRRIVVKYTDESLLPDPDGTVILQKVSDNAEVHQMICLGKFLNPSMNSSGSYTNLIEQ
jgi:hypothetical protein